MLLQAQAAASATDQYRIDHGAAQPDSGRPMNDYRRAGNGPRATDHGHHIETVVSNSTRVRTPWPVGPLAI